ncbi:unnamed protein product [Calypogeia fissa]
MLSSQRKKKEVPRPLKDVTPVDDDDTTNGNTNNKWYAFYKEKFGSSPSRRTATSINLNRLPHKPPQSELVALLSHGERGLSQQTTGNPNEQQTRVLRSSMKGSDSSSIVLPLTFKRIPSYDEERRKSPVRVLGGAAGGCNNKRDGNKPIGVGGGVGRSISSKNLDNNNNSDSRRRPSVTQKDVDNIYVPSSRAYGSGEPSSGRTLPAAGRPSGSNVTTTSSSAARELYKKFESLPSYQSELLRGQAQGRRRQSTSTSSTSTIVSPISYSAVENNTYEKIPENKTPSSSSSKFRKPSYGSGNSGLGGSGGYLFQNERRGGAAAAEGPSFPEESSSQSSNESLGGGGVAPGSSSSQHNRPDPPADESNKNNDDNSSCSSSPSVSPHSLNSRLTEMKLLNSDPPHQQQQEEQGRRPSATTSGDPQFAAGSSSDSGRRPSYTNDYSRAGSSLAVGMQNYSGVGNRNNSQCSGSGSGSGRDIHGLVGLVNEGNTCYLNSCLQCLAHSMPLASAVQGPIEALVVQRRGSGSRAGTSDGRDFSSLAELLSYAFRQVVRDLWQRPAFSATSARTFLQCVQAWAPQFAGHSQHDAQEVLRAILDGLHEALNRVITAPPYRDLYLEPKPEEELAELTWRYHKLCQDSIIQDIFCGQLQSTIECCTCHRKSHCFDPFHDLSLPLPKNERESSIRDSFRGGNSRSRVTLQDCLSAFVTPEQLEGSNKYYCPSCKGPRTSMKKLTLYRLPPILVLHIKRFYKSERFSYQKDDTPVYYPLQGLDFTDFLSARARKVRRGGVVYDLYSVCCHMGSLGCGHYTAQCRNCENDMWYCFNDSTVSPIQDSAVLSSTAYILFYQQRS